MIAPLEVVKGMELTPQACVLCSNNPVDEITGKQKPAIFAPGVDYDWGNSIYICWSCAEIIADLRGGASAEEHQALLAKYEALDEEHTEMLEDHERMKALMARITDGRDAVREVKASAKPAKKKAVSK